MIVETTSSTESYKVDPDSKVSVLKSLIKQKSNVNKTEYTLKKGDLILDDNKTIASQHIVDQTKLSADFNSISISVKILGEIKTITVDPDNKVSSISDKISAEGFDTGFSLILGG